MAKYTVRKDQRYKCRIELSWLESFATNEDIAERLVKAGFINVDVMGEDYKREAEGTWSHADATAEMPTQVVHVELVA